MVSVMWNVLFNKRWYVAAMALTTIVGPLSAQARPKATTRVRCRDCDTTARDDSTRASARRPLRVTTNAGGFEMEVERLVSELVERRRVQLQLDQQLQRLSTLDRSAAAAEAARTDMEAQQVKRRLESTTRQTSLLRRRLASLCGSSQPEGWMGIGLSAAYSTLRRNNGPIVYRFHENPTVETVEPGSPAEAAGVRRDDRIVEMNGHELRGSEIVLAQLLKPGSKLPLRVIRDGKERQVVLLVKRRPEALDDGCPWLDEKMAAAFEDGPQQFRFELAVPEPARAPRIPTTPAPSVLMPTPTPPRTPRAAVAPGPPTIVEVSPESPRTRIVMVPAAPLPPMAATAPMLAGFSLRLPVAGADLVRVGPDLAPYFGVEQGVLVVDVARGTPAADAGLKGGDVIVSVNGAPLRDASGLRRAIEEATDDQVTLRVVREKRPRTMTLRW
jgi:hypothetical protein